MRSRRARLRRRLFAKKAPTKTAGAILPLTIRVERVYDE